MLWYQAVILGIVQGLTEFLPISSSGHLILFPQVFGWPVQPLVFDVVLHLGTAAALVAFFVKDLLIIAKAFVRDAQSKKTRFAQYSPDGKVVWYILIGSIPAVVAGLMFDDYIETHLRAVSVVATFLFFGSVLMALAEVCVKRIGTLNNNFSTAHSLGIGVFQALALFPGLSRSGATISGGILLGLTREQAARFSFLLSIPVVIGAGLFKVVGAFGSTFSAPDIFPLVLGFIASFGVGMAAIKFLLKFLKTRSLWVFIGYRLLLAGFLAVMVST